MQKGDKFARVLGVVVFLAGIAVLVLTFVQAYSLFASPHSAISLQPAEPGGPKVSSTLGSNAIMLLGRIGLLFIMAIVGSLVASRGIQF